MTCGDMTSNLAGGVFPFYLELIKMLDTKKGNYTFFMNVDLSNLKKEFKPFFYQFYGTNKKQMGKDLTKCKELMEEVREMCDKHYL